MKRSLRKGLSIYLALTLLFSSAFAPFSPSTSRVWAYDEEEIVVLSDDENEDAAAADETPALDASEPGADSSPVVDEPSTPNQPSGLNDPDEHSDEGTTVSEPDGQAVTDASGTMPSETLSPQRSEVILLEIDGQRVDLGRNPQLISGRLLVPVRVFSEYFGAIVHWEGEEERVSISSDETVIALQIGNQEAMVGTETVLMDVAALIEDSSTYVPLRFLAEALGVAVHYDGDLNIVYATSPQPEPEPEPEPEIEIEEPTESEEPSQQSEPASEAVKPPSSTVSRPASTGSTSNATKTGDPALLTISGVKKLSTGVELEIVSKEKISYKTLNLKNPERFVIDLENTTTDQAKETLAVASAGITSIRYAQHGGDTPYTRVVFDLESSNRGLDVSLSKDGKTLTVRSSFYYMNTIRTLRYTSGEELLFNFDGGIVPQIENKYLSASSTSPVSLPSSLIASGIDSKSSKVASVSKASSSGSSVSASDASTSAKAGSIAERSSGTSSASVSVEAEVYSGITGDTVYGAAYARVQSGVYPANRGGSLEFVTIATTTDDLNFRSGPGLDQEVLQVLPTGSEAELLRELGDWALLRLDDGSEGWCNTEYLSYSQRQVEDSSSDRTGSESVPEQNETKSQSSGTASASTSASSEEAPTKASSSASTASSASASSSASKPASLPAATEKLPSGMKELTATEYGVGDSFRIYLPGVFPELPDDYAKASNTLVKNMTMTAAQDGAWLNIDLKTGMPYQISIVNGQLEIALNLDTKVEQLKLSKDASGSMVTIDMSRTVGYDVEYLNNPDRIIVTVPGALFEDIPAQQLIRDGLINQIRTSYIGEDARITLELEYLIGYRVVSDKRSNTIQVRFYTKGLEGKTIFLDPGHGGNPRLGGDTGAISYNAPTFYEATSTIDIGLKLRNLLEAAGATVVMSRDGDITISLEERVELANASTADILVSIHHNSSTNPAGHGLETYYWAQTADRQRLAQSLQASVVRNLNLTDRGVKREEFYMVKYPTMPSALVELAFLSNPVEEKLIRDEMWRQRAANALFEGIRDFFD